MLQDFLGGGCPQLRIYFTNPVLFWDPSRARQYISPVSKSLLQGLLNRQPEARLGGGPGDGAALSGRSRVFYR